WLWRFFVERSSWWRVLIDIKYPNPLSQWQTKECKRGFSGSPWVSISKEYSLFWKHAFIDPGGGVEVSFWHDCWISRQTLAASFPRVAAAALYPGAQISDSVSFDGESVSWDLSLNVSLRGGAERERENLVSFLHSVESQYTFSGPCRLVWSLGNSASFTVCSLYRNLSKMKFQGVLNFPVLSVWRKVVPLKVNFFIWCAFHAKILTIDNLKRRGFALANRCLLCGASEESIDHLFVDCAFTREVWSELGSRCRLNVSPACSFVATVRCWPASIPEDNAKWVLYCFLHATCWMIWNERNARIFKDECHGSGYVSRKISRHVSEWLIAHGKCDRVDFIGQVVL
ncbi:unnamed protein product, partial [Linum tenue]